ALEQRDPAAQRLLEVEFAAHRLGGDPGDLVGAAGVLGEQLDDLALDQRGVDVHHDQVLGAALQAGGLQGDVDLLGGRLGGEVAAEPLRVGAGDLQLDGGDRVAGQPLDPLDVGAGAGDRGGDRAQRARAQRVGQHGDVQPAVGDRGDPVVAGRELGLHLQVDGGLLDGAADLFEDAVPADAGGDALVHGEQGAEDQPPSDHDLVQVDEDHGED